MSASRARLQRLVQSLGKFHKPKPQLREAEKKTKWNILRGDKVQVIGNHPERGKQGKIIKKIVGRSNIKRHQANPYFHSGTGIVKTVLRDKDRVIVEGVNMGTRNIKGDKDRGIPGRSIQIERTMHASNVQLVDPVTGGPTRIYKKYLDTGEKVRIAKKSGAIIPRPEILSFRKRPINSIITESDTAEDDVWAVTYTDYVPLTK